MRIFKVNSPQLSVTLNELVDDKVSPPSILLTPNGGGDAVTVDTKFLDEHSIEAALMEADRGIGSAK
jgi:hypothetical protein